MRLAIAAAVLLLPLASLAQNHETTPPACTVAQLTLGNCVSAVKGTQVRVTDAQDATDCTNGLGSGFTNVCVYDGSNWVLGPLIPSGSLNATDLGTGSVDFDEIASGAVGNDELSDIACTSIKSFSINPTEAGATDDFINLIDNTISSTDAAEDDFIVPKDMSVHNMRVDVDVAPGAGKDPWTITIEDDGADTLVTCQIDETATTCSSAASTILAAGSDMTVRVQSSGPDVDPNAAAQMRGSFCLVAQ